MMLAPFLIILSGWLARKDAGTRPASPDADHPPQARLAVPRFAFAFVGVLLFNSLHLLPAAAVAATTQSDTLLLAMAMAALGLATHVSSIRHAGIRPLLLALILFIWLVVGGALINRWIFGLLG